MSSRLWEPLIEHDSRGHLAQSAASFHASPIDERFITRDEVVALLFNVSDIAASLSRIEELLGGDNGEEEADGS